MTKGEQKQDRHENDKDPDKIELAKETIEDLTAPEDDADDVVGGSYWACPGSTNRALCN
jgi:hypothetical protein